MHVSTVCLMHTSFGILKPVHFQAKSNQQWIVEVSLLVLISDDHVQECSCLVSALTKKIELVFMYLIRHLIFCLWIVHC